MSLHRFNSNTHAMEEMAGANDLYWMWRNCGFNGEPVDFLKWMRAQGGGSGEVGEIFGWGSPTPPPYALAVDGSTYSIEDYQELFDLYRDTFIVTYDSETFTLRDWRGEFPRFYDPTGIRDPDGATRVIGDHQDGTELPRIYNMNTNNLYAPRDQEARNVDSKVNLVPMMRISSTFTADSSGAGQLLVPRPTNAGVMPCVRFKRNELIVCEGHFQNQSVSANASITLVPIFDRGDESLVDGVKFVAPFKGLYTMSVGGGAFQTSCTSYSCVLKNVEADGLISGTRIALNPGAASYDVPALTVNVRLEESEFLAVGAYSSVAQSTINNFGTTHYFTFACLERG